MSNALSRDDQRPMTELIKPGKNLAVHRGYQLATARWVDWFNLYQYCGRHPRQSARGLPAA